MNPNKSNKQINQIDSYIIKYLLNIAHFFIFYPISNQNIQYLQLVKGCGVGKTVGG